MNCTTARRLLTLSRPGERTAAETEALLHHLADCPACREERSVIESAVTGFRRTAAAEPTVPDSTVAATAVIRRLQQSSSSPSPIAEALLRPARVPSVRFALIACVLIAVVSFGVQASTTLWEMHQLEIRFAEHAPVAGAQSAFGSDLASVPLTAAQQQSLRSLERADADRLFAAAGLDRLLQPVLNGASVDAAVHALLGDTPEARTIVRLLRAHPGAVSRLFGKGE